MVSGTVQLCQVLASLHCVLLLPSFDSNQIIDSRCEWLIRYKFYQCTNDLSPTSPLIDGVAILSALETISGRGSVHRRLFHRA